MTITNTSRQKLHNLHQQDPAFLKSALAQIHNGDAEALKGLSARSGISDEAELKGAAATFMATSIDRLFALGRERKVMDAIGVSAQPFSAPASPQNHLNSILALRSGQVEHGALKSKLTESQSAIENHQEQLRGLNEQHSKAEAEITALDPQWRERDSSTFLSRLSFGAAKRQGLEEKIDELGTQISTATRAIAYHKGKMKEAVMDQLQLSASPDFKVLQKNLDAAKAFEKQFGDFRMNVFSANSAASSAAYTKKGSQIREADSKLKDVMLQLPLMEKQVEQLLGQDIQFPQATTYSRGSALKPQAKVSSEVAAHNLERSKSEMSALMDVVKVAQRALQAHLESLEGAMQTMVETTAQKVLNS